MYGYIYKNTCLVNGKIYIGLHKSLNEGLDENYWGSGPWFTNALKKYGEECWKREIIDTADSLEELSKKEIYWISIYYPNGVPDTNIGYNQDYGGYHFIGYKRGPVKDITIERWRATMKARNLWPAGENNPMYGKGYLLSGSKNGRYKGGVVCIELDKVFETAKEAAKFVGGKSYSHIVGCCNGKEKKAFGYTWKWLNDSEV